MTQRAGSLQINLTGDISYKSFLPAPLPPVPAIELDQEAISLLVKANSQLAVLESIVSRIPNAALFVSMYVRKEALLSSQIEGKQASLDDILDPMVEENTNLNVADVVNFIKATEFALLRRKELPLCCRLMKEIHATLMEGVCSKKKGSGEFRTSQNWIGGQGSNLKTAHYIPPAPQEMNVAMSDLEKYINSDDSLDVLIRAALIHYQFETIHPFLDGNGRVGRLLITLFLMEKKVLSTPALYISGFLKCNRNEYYDRMTEVRVKGNYEQWVKFFLEAIYVSALDATQTIDLLIALHNRNVKIVSAMGRSSATVQRIFAYLESNPIIDIKKTAASLELSYNTVAGAVEKLIDVGILIKTSNVAKNRTFAYHEYLQLLRKDT